MVKKEIILWSSLIPLCLASKHENEEVTLETQLGDVVGTTLYSIPSNLPYSSFYAIPYATVPAGRLTPSVVISEAFEDGVFNASLDALLEKGEDNKVMSNIMPIMTIIVFVRKCITDNS